MKITAENHLFHLQSEGVSLILEEKNGVVLTRYFGEELPFYTLREDKAAYKRSFAIESREFPDRFADELPLALAQQGQGDYRIDGLRLWNPFEGREFYDFKLTDWQIKDDLPSSAVLPFVKGKGKTLVLHYTCADCPIVYEQLFSVMEGFSGIVCSTRITNSSENELVVENLMSLSLDLADEEYQLLSLCGSHIHEGDVQRIDLFEGTASFESLRGCSSSQHPPYFALIEKRADYSHGVTVAASMLYSGNHLERVEKDQVGNLRVQMGMHPQTLNWNLRPDETLESPQVLLGWSSRGLNGMARNFHRALRSHVLREKEHPILINSWESVYYDTTQQNLETLLEQADDLGMELFVLDDGWFRKDNSSRAPIGDWKVNHEKLPEGLEGIARKVTERGMKFGLWFEPEAVSENSQLAASHPDWILKDDWNRPALGRHELLLDLANPEVVDHLIDMLDGYLKSGLISNVKWDMNRPMSEASRRGQAHQYILGLYRILKTITEKYPEVCIEGCSSGGNRLDAGMLSFVFQNWASDNTDPFDRKRIQSGLSLFFPPEVLSAHVSASPNHQTGRMSNMNARFQTARFFSCGYELNLNECSKEEKEEIRMQIQQLKADRDVYKNAEFYQPSPDEWVFVSSDKSKATALIFQEHFDVKKAYRFWKIPGLIPEGLYEISPLQMTLTGQELEQIGLQIPQITEDFHATCLELRQVGMRTA